MKIVFLDFDGVMNIWWSSGYSFPPCLELLPEKMELLRRIIQQTGARIVLSTSWREHWSADPALRDGTGKEIDQHFAQYGLTIFDKIPDHRLRREELIGLWLEGHPEVERYVILDDALMDGPHIRGHLLSTRSWRGLDESVANQAIQLLGKDPTLRKKIFAVSDIHGHCALLKKALQDAGFDNDDPNHLFVGCGDYFDRGCENYEVLIFLESLKHKVLLRGNHEDLLTSALETGRISEKCLKNGAVETLRRFFGKYSVDTERMTLRLNGRNRMADWLSEFFGQMRDYYETRWYTFIHGWFPKSVPLDKATGEMWRQARILHWNRNYFGTPPLPGKMLVCGHIPTREWMEYEPWRYADINGIFHGNGLIAIDAGTCDSGQVNVLVLDVEEDAIC